jgi:hypothetical protein
MRKLQKQMRSLAKSLSVLAKELEKTAGQMDKSVSLKSTASALKKRPAKKADGAGGQGSTVLDMVYDKIKKSRKGISIPQLREKTSLGSRQLSNALYKLTKKELVTTVARGVYAKK